MQRDVKTEEKALRIKSLIKLNKVRKFFCMGEKELDWKQEDEDAANATSKEKTGEEKSVVEMVHVSHRAYEFSIDGRVYRWTGTRMHSGAVLRALRLKGFAYSIKVCTVHNSPSLSSPFAFLEPLLMISSGTSWFESMIINSLPPSKRYSHAAGNNPEIYTSTLTRSCPSG